MSFLTSIYSLGNIMDGVDIENLTIEQYLELIKENHAPSVGIKVDDITIAEYLEYEETIKTQDYDDYQPHLAKDDVPTRYKGHLSPRHKSPDPPLDAKTNPYFQASLSPIHPKITQTPTVSEHLSERPTSQDKLSYEAGGIPDKNLKHYWKSTNDDDRIGLEWEGLSCPNGEDPEKCGETKTRAIIGAMINKLPEEWFSRVSKDKDDLEGIIDYLEPTLYNGFIDHNDEAYKRRKNKLLGMPYTEPPLIVKEEAKITGYNLGAGEEALTRLNSSTWATKWFKRLVAYAKCNRDSYERDKELVERRR
ncbi:hypothetical protein Tco_1568444 [Tanacetum coccineum]